mmetsp:Transcript_13032/g.38305  ORF Transcript_13032/g.38305 Transcript_13032/m.38305 type:complete len:81 (-) Transcript_13032:1550-1792(-)
MPKPNLGEQQNGRGYPDGYMSKLGGARGRTGISRFREKEREREKAWERKKAEALRRNVNSEKGRSGAKEKSADHKRGEAT